jgi:hypothetical protein
MMETIYNSKKLNSEARSVARFFKGSKLVFWELRFSCGIDHLQMIVTLFRDGQTFTVNHAI